MREEASEISAALTNPPKQERRSAKRRQVGIGMAIPTLWVFGENDKSGCRLRLVEISLLNE